MPLTRIDLDLMAAKGCQAPGCKNHDHTIFLHGRCHMSAGLDVSYTRDSRALVIVCARCKRHVATVAVADEEPPPATPE